MTISLTSTTSVLVNSKSLLCYGKFTKIFLYLVLLMLKSSNLIILDESGYTCLCIKRIFWIDFIWKFFNSLTQVSDGGEDLRSHT